MLATAMIYRVVSVTKNGERTIISEHHSRDAAEHSRKMIASYDEIRIEPGTDVRASPAK